MHATRLVLIALLTHGAAVAQEAKRPPITGIAFVRVEFMTFTPSQKPCCSDFTGPHPRPD